MRQGLVIWVALAGLLVGCANLPEARVASPGKGIPTNTIPPNYRQQVAQSLSRAVNPRDFRAARISRPVTRSLSAFGGEQRKQKGRDAAFAQRHWNTHTGAASISKSRFLMSIIFTSERLKQGRRSTSPWRNAGIAKGKRKQAIDSSF
jgi:hypothetical protein